MSENTDQNFWVIGVGSSAGGLEALSSFFKSLPEKPNAAFIVAQHLAPHAKSMMVELIGRQTKMPVISVSDHLTIEPGLICIVPPNFDVTTKDGQLRLTPAGIETRPKPSVDLFFQSIAKVYGRRSVGIILSGTGSDGSEGIRAIKENGGVTIVQDSESAKYDGMPKSAFETGLVDAVLPPEKIAEQLFFILQNRESEILPPVKIRQDSDFEKILKYLKKEIGADFTQYKVGTVQRRIEKRLSALKITTLQDYFTYLQNNNVELGLLSQNMLVSVTAFFRDPDAFQALGQCLEQMIIKKSSEDEIRIWIAGCATGEEPYSFAMLISEIFERVGKRIPTKIFATDMDHEALVYARNGFYTMDEMQGLPEELLEKYFDRRDKTYEIRKSIKDMIVFARQDIIQNPPFVKLDLISCRNVLIYFESTLQNRVFEIFHYALKAQGILFLGKSENALPTLFETIDRKEKIFKRIHATSQLSYYPANKYKINTSSIIHQTKKRPENLRTISETASLQLVKMHQLAGVVVDEESAIIHIIGDVAEFIGFPTGLADFRLTNLLNKNAVVEFSVLLKKSAKEGKTQRSRTYKFENHPKKSFSFSVKPFEMDDPAQKSLFLVSFEHRKQLAVVEPATQHSQDVPNRMMELEQEVAATRENLQTVIEELEVSNEELQSLNEEMSSTNEELQASNEELETTNEELQSTNEELLTLNEELNVKSSELKLAYTSLENIQSSISSPLIVIDTDLRIVRYNSSVNQIFNLSHSDLGNPITKASCQCEIPEFEESIRTTLRSGKMTEVLCETPKKIFQMRVHPNMDDQKKIVGAIIVFFDNTDFIKTQDKLKSSDKRIRAIIDSSPTLISLKDNVGKYLMANESFTKFFNLSEDQIIGKTDREIFPDLLSNEFRDNDLEVLLRRTPTEKEEVIEYNGKTLVFLSNRFPLFGHNDRNPYAVGVVALDITEQKNSQKNLLQSEARYRAIIEDQAVFVCRHLATGQITFTNNAFNNYFGGSRESNLQETFFSFVEKVDLPRIKGELEKLSAQHPIVQYEQRTLRGHQARWVRWIHRGIFDEHEHLIEYQAVGFDVTEIHNQTRELLVKENLYTHVLEHTSDYLSVYRQEGESFILESFNQSAAKNRGFGNPRLIGKNLLELLDETHAQDVLQKYKKAVETGSIMNFEENLEGPGGILYLSTTIVPILDREQNQTRVVALSRDITKLKRIEKALRSEKKNADSANMAKSDFLASMSHELRTPLNVIMGMSQLLARVDIKPEHLRLVESIQRSSKVLLALIEDVLDLAKIEAGKINFEIKPVSLDQVTSDVVQAFETQASAKHIRLLRNFKINSETIVLADQVRLKQILINLVGNAIKFTDQGSVTLNVEIENSDSPHVTLYFEVIDTGVGIPTESFPKIFKRFSQADSGTSRKFGGTGLGLAISKQLVELMNGTIGFDSREGEGSVFWFRIRLDEAQALTLEKRSEPKVQIDFQKLKCLAVDDNPESLKVLKLLFAEHAGKLVTAESGQEAIDHLQKEKFDLVLMDMQMPQMDGLEATRLIRKGSGPNKEVTIIALTANAMSGDREKCLASGMNDYMTKPVDFDGLKTMINNWIKL
jgi:two-component system, chemotaxis family, CheB/CheR fusion protein